VGQWRQENKKEGIMRSTEEETFITYLKDLKVDNPEKTLKEIRNEGKHLELKDVNGVTPVHIACLLGFTEVTRYIAAKRKDLINSPDNQGDTPLHWACLGHKHEIIQFLVENGANMDAVTNEGGIKPLFRLIATDNSKTDFDSMTLMLDKSENGVNLAKEALKCCGINHVDPNQPTGDRKFLNEYIQSKSAQKEGSWVKVENDRTLGQGQSFTK